MRNMTCGGRLLIRLLNEELSPSHGPAPGIRIAFLFGDDFNRADRGVVHCRSEIDLDFALWRGFNMREGLDQGLGAGLAEDVKSFQKHGSVARDIKNAAAHASNAAILDAKPMLHEVKSQRVSSVCRNRHYIMEVPKTMPLVETAIGDFGQISPETTKAAAEKVPVRHPDIAGGIVVRGMSHDNPDRKYAMGNAL